MSRTFHLPRHESVDLVAQFDAHLADCPRCRSAASFRGACPEGRAVHEGMVRDAHRSALRAELWHQQLDLADLPNQRAFDEAVGQLLSPGPIEGVDVSAWQGRFPWDEAVAAGIGWGIAKSSEGDGFTDPRWPGNLVALLSPGPLIAGSYHFLRPDLGNAPTAEANWYLGRHPIDCFSPTVPWIFALDAESASGSAAGCYAFMDEVSSRIGYSCWFYSYASWIASRGVAAYNRPLWLAWPNPGDPPLAGWPVLTAHQYGTRPMSVGQVDADRFLGDLSALLTLAGVSTSQPVPAPPPPPPPLEDDDMGDVAYLDASAELNQQHLLWVDAKGQLLQAVFDNTTAIWSELPITTGLASRTPVTATVRADLKQVQLAARGADGRVLHAWANFGDAWNLEWHGQPDGGVVGIDVNALAAALAPQLHPSFNEAKLITDLVAVLPGANAAAIQAALAKALAE